MIQKKEVGHLGHSHVLRYDIIVLIGRLGIRFLKVVSVGLGSS